ncbi:MAG: DNA adenine methylase [Thermoplasmata archaeon]
MSHLKLIKYPGSKNSLIPTIKKSFVDSGADTFVDVFGGSGVVSLNMDAKQVVYNDINKDLYNLFKMIKFHPELILEVLKKWTATKDKFVEYNEIFNSRGNRNMTDLERAFRTFYGFSIGFGGMGSTYRTQNEKSTYSQTLKVISNYQTISSKVSSWIIENMDFRQIFTKFDDVNAFFYCDPPYSGKNWYEHPFGSYDFKELKLNIQNLKGKYLLSFNESDPLVIEIFGTPNFSVEFENKNRKNIPSGPAPLRRFLIYTNVI